VIFTLHRFGRSLGLDAIIRERAASERTSSAGARLSGRWLNALT